MARTPDRPIEELPTTAALGDLVEAADLFDAVGDQLHRAIKRALGMGFTWDDVAECLDVQRGHTARALYRQLGLAPAVRAAHPARCRA